MKIGETVRKDGLRIISCSIKSKRTHVSIQAGVGSAYDPPEQQGFFHCFEHMAFKGTERRTANDIQNFSGRNLLWNNAFTGRLETRYTGEAVVHKLPLLVEILADIYCRSSIPAHELALEKEVILNEIARDRDEDWYPAYWALWERLWKQNPLRIFGVGTPDGIRSVQRDELLEAQRRWYVPNNTTIVGVGDFSHEAFTALIKKYMPPRFRETAAVLSGGWNDEYGDLPSEQTALLLRPDREKAIVLMGCKFPLSGDERTETAGLLMERMLAKGGNSLCTTEIREKRGLAYSVGGSISLHPPLGAYFAVGAEVLPNRVDLVREIMSTIIYRPLTDERMLETVREGLDDRFRLGYENPGQWASRIFKELALGRPPARLEQYFARRRALLASITLDEIEALRSAIAPERCVTVVMQPQ